MKVKIGVVQAKGYLGEEAAAKQQEDALNYIAEAAKQGVKILCFPEWYPGSTDLPLTQTALDQLCEASKANKIHVIAGGLELNDADDSVFTTHYVIDDSGEIIGKYQRTTSAGPQIYDAVFKFSRKLSWGNELPVFPTKYGNIGVLFCSEVYTPELARVLALKGADIIFMPAGGLLWTKSKTWRNLAWSRAIENIAYSAMCTHVYGVEEGIALICSPEEILADSDKEGIKSAVIDLERLKYLREQDALGENKFLVGIQTGKSSGLCFYNHMGDSISRRPELYAPITMSEEELNKIKIG